MTNELAYRKTIDPDLHSFFDGLLLPMDDMWQQAIIAPANHQEILLNGRPVGFFSVDEENRLLAFHLSEYHREWDRKIFKSLLEDRGIVEGFACSLDLKSLPLFLDNAREMTLHTLLYQHLKNARSEWPFEEILKRSATDQDFARVLSYHEVHLGPLEEWVAPYYRGLIDRSQLYLYERSRRLIATGEVRRDERREGFDHLGVSVAVDQRKQGLATAILTDLKEECIRYGRTPICSTSITNLASQGAIESAGFHAGHRILKVGFHHHL